jgi:putative DNA primase/helicase
MRKIDLTAIKAEDITDTPNIVTPMPEPIEVPAKLKAALGGEPDSMWIYRIADGSAFGAVARWNPEGKRKEIRPIVWDGKKFITSGFGPSRPLYNSDMIAAAPTAPVLIVEGEKAADAAPQYLPEGWVVSTWQGGANAVEQTSWDILEGHSVVVWPDNDGAGAQAAIEIQKILARHAVPVSIVGLSPAFPDGWDLGDELPAKVKPENITGLLRRELKRAAVATPDKPVKVKEVKDYDEDEAREWRPLGYDNNKYMLQTQHRGQVDVFDPDRLMSQKGCINIYGDIAHWGGQQGKPDGKGVDWIQAGIQIMDSCHKLGVYDPKRLRGRGIWIDKGEDGVDRAVMNAGSKLVVSRAGTETREIPFVRFKSRWIYQKSPDLILNIDDYDARASDDDGRMIRELCNKVRWDAPIYGDLLAGWIATAVVCGGLQWRTHAWVTGNQGSGKSTIVNEIAGACLGDLAIYPLGATTEAGIRQLVRNDAMPVVFDESESDSKNKVNNEARRQAVLDLMRQASSEGRGRILKGSANHSAQAFTMRSSFLMSSIGVGLKEAADLTRTAVLTIKPLDSYSHEERRKKEQEFKDFLSLASEIPRDMPQRLVARQLHNLFTLRHNVEIFKETIAVMLANRRIGDQLGTLMAGCFSLYSAKRLDMKQCEKYLNTVNLDEFLQVKTEREDITLLHHIVGSMIRVETVHGSQERTIGELMVICFTRDDTMDVRLKVAETTLARYGMKIEREHGNVTGVWVGQSIQSMNRIMQTSVYFEGWAGVLMRHPYAKKSVNSISFGGTSARAIFLPKQEWPVGLWD